MEDILLKVEDLETLVNSKKVNFSAEKGDIICIFGLNGCGKSVLLKTLCGVVDKKQGSILYNIDKKQLGVCLQFPEHLIFKETALETLESAFNNTVLLILKFIIFSFIFITYTYINFI